MHLGQLGGTRYKVSKGSGWLGLASESLGHLGLHFLAESPGSFVKLESGTEIFGLFRFRAIYKEGCESRNTSGEGRLKSEALVPGSCPDSYSL
jgi:hypothetical protein